MAGKPCLLERRAEARRVGNRSRLRKGSLTVRGALVLTEIALSLMLSIGAGLLVQSFVRAANADLGIDPENVVTMTMATNGRKGPAFYYDLLTRIQALPGIERAALSSATPMGPGGWETRMTMDGRPADAIPIRAMINVVTPDFLDTHRIRIAEGRGFTSADTAGMRVAAVSRAFADTAWPGQPAIGRRVRHEGEWHTVIGVAATRSSARLEEPRKNVLYVPMRLEASAESFMVPNAISVRTAVDSASAARAIQAQLRELDAAAPLFNIVTMGERVNRVTARYRYSAVLMTALAGLALLLAAMGNVRSHRLCGHRKDAGDRHPDGARGSPARRPAAGRGRRPSAGRGRHRGWSRRSVCWDPSSGGIAVRRQPRGCEHLRGHRNVDGDGCGRRELPPGPPGD